MLSSPTPSGVSIVHWGSSRLCFLLQSWATSTSMCRKGVSPVVNLWLLDIAELCQHVNLCEHLLWCEQMKNKTHLTQNLKTFKHEICWAGVNQTSTSSILFPSVWQNLLGFWWNVVLSPFDRVTELAAKDVAVCFVPQTNFNGCQTERRESMARKNTLRIMLNMLQSSYCMFDTLI